MDLDELARRWAPTHPRLKAAGMPPWLEDDEDEDDKAKAEAPLTSGVMIAFYPSPDVASALALQVQDTSLPEGATPEEPEELHLTLAYFGKLGEGFQEASSADLVEAARTWAQRQAPVRCSTSGIGIFDTPDGMVTWASVDGPDLSRMRHELVTELGQAGLQAANDHGFTPHITLCWADCRNAQLSKQELVFSTVSVVIAGVRTDIPLGVPSNDEDMSKLDSLGRPKTSAVITEPESAPAPKVREEAHSGDWSFVTTVGQRTVVTASASTSATWDKPLSSNPHMLWIQGRFVGAETPNRNNAYWASSDLEIGQPTVSYGPLNWLHEERHIIGAIADSRFIPRRGGVEAAAETADPHIVVAANIWRWIYPEEASVIEMASEAGALAMCVDDDTEIMTELGWKRFESLQLTDRILTMDREAQLSRWSDLQKIHKYEVDEELVSMEGQQHSSLTTANHKWWTRHRKGTGKSARRFVESASLNTNDYIPRAIPMANYPAEPKYVDDFIELIAWSWTDACITKKKTGNQRACVTIFQSEVGNPEKVARIDAMFARLGLLVARTVRDGGYVNWRLRAGQSEPILAVLDANGLPSHDFIRALTRSQLELFIAVSMLADGTVHKGHGQRVFYAETEGEAKVMEFACALLGQVTNTTSTHSVKYSLLRPQQILNGKPIRVNKDIYRVCLARRSTEIAPVRLAKMKKGFIIEKRRYRGTVWCPQTLDGTFLARRNGTVYWTGNSMECTSEKVGCVGDKGCGREYSYEDYLRGLTCDCVQERASVRRFINPTFLGGGIIVPPSRPGWADADMRVLASNQASDAFDQAGRPDMPVAQWDQIVAGAVKYATMLA